MFTFDEFWGSVGTSIFGNSSSAANNSRLRLPSKLSFCFWRLCQNIDSQQYNVNDPISENINDPFLKAIARYRSHPSIVPIRNFVVLNLIFYSKMFIKEKTPKELNNLNINKATQNPNIPTKIIKESSNIFGDFIFSNLNCCINTSLFPSLLKRADITPVHKMDSKSVK